MGIEGLGVGEEGLGLVWRAQGRCKLPGKSLGAKDGFEGPDVGVKGFECVWRAWDDW